MVGMDDLGGISQPWWFCDSVVAFCMRLVFLCTLEHASWVHQAVCSLSFPCSCILSKLLLFDVRFLSHKLAQKHCTSSTVHSSDGIKRLPASLIYFCLFFALVSNIDDIWFYALVYIALCGLPFSAPVCKPSHISMSAWKGDFPISFGINSICAQQLWKKLS